MQWRWFNNVMVNFADPITLDDFKEWRAQHILAHVVGGAAWWSLGVLGVIGFAHAPVWRQTAGVGLWQATIWEWWQHEMWDAVCILRGWPSGKGYPWLSAIWDALLAMLGASIVALLWVVLR